MPISIDDLTGFLEKLNSEVAPDTVAMRYQRKSPTKLREMREEFSDRWRSRVKLSRHAAQKIKSNPDNNRIEAISVQSKQAKTYNYTELGQKKLLECIVKLNEDGGAVAAKLPKKPVVVVAGSSSDIGGSAFRTNPDAGDAQEEKMNETYAIAVTLALDPNIGDKIEGGVFKYTPQCHEFLENQRGALRVDNVSGGRLGCDAVIICAPDLKNSLFYKGLVDQNGPTNFLDPRWDTYIQEIYQMYQNLAAALVADPDQPVVLTLPGAGVFSQNSQEAKLIQGICLRMAVEDFPVLKHKINQGLVTLPYPEQTVMAGFNCSDPGAQAIFDRIQLNANLLSQQQQAVMAEPPSPMDLAGGAGRAWTPGRDVRVSANRPMTLLISLLDSYGKIRTTGGFDPLEEGVRNWTIGRGRTSNKMYVANDQYQFDLMEDGQIMCLDKRKQYAPVSPMPNITLPIELIEKFVDQARLVQALARYGEIRTTGGFDPLEENVRNWTIGRGKRSNNMYVANDQYQFNLDNDKIICLDKKNRYAQVSPMPDIRFPIELIEQFVQGKLPKRPSP